MLSHTLARVRPPRPSAEARRRAIAEARLAYRANLEALVANDAKTSPARAARLHLVFDLVGIAALGLIYVAVFVGIIALPSGGAGHTTLTAAGVALRETLLYILGALALGTTVVGCIYLYFRHQQTKDKKRIGKKS